MKKIIGSLVIMGIFLMPFSSFTPKVFAQTFNILGNGSSMVNGSLGVSDNGGSDSSASGIITGLAPAITQLPGCKAALKNSIKNLFNGTNGLDYNTSSQTTTPYGPTEDGGNLSDALNLGTDTIDSVPVSDPAVLHNTQLILNNTKSIQSSETSINTNQTCYDAIGKMIIKILIQKMTLSIVNWIQTGNGGGPMFLTDPSKFFSDIAKTQILGFGLEISDPTKFPFGKDFMQNTALAFNQKFSDNATYSLDKMIKDTNPQFSAATFNEDFSQGGWNAWDALTQVPANNPLGFNMMASEELGKRLEGTDQSPATVANNALLAGNGFLGAQSCTDPSGVTKDEDNAYLAGDKTYAPTGAAPRHCNTWEYVTPGSVVAHTLTKGMDDNQNSLLDATTLNDAIAAILDAALARFSNELTTKGLAAIDTNNQAAHLYDLSSDSSDLTDSNGHTGTIFPVSTTWLTQNSNFDITNDLNQALVDTQRTYSDKLILYDNTLNSLIENIHQLDYCIPGPNPDWETTSHEVMENLLSGKTPTSGKWMNSVTATILTSLPILGTIVGIIGHKADEHTEEDHIATFIETILGVNINHNQKDIQDISGLNSFFESVFQSYASMINKIYFDPTRTGYNKYMPPVTDEARTKFEEIPGYQQIISDNSAKITSMKSVITQLEDLKDAMNQLNGQLTSNTIEDGSGNIATDQQEQYNTNLTQIISAFGRLSSQMASGDDIANIDNLSKQANDENTYVHDNLLTGPYGCEKFMSNLWNTNKATYSIYARRQPYPYQIDHLYGPVNANGGPYYISWSPTAITDPNEGFLYGALYHNAAFGPWSADITSHACPEFITTIETSNLDGFKTSANYADQPTVHPNGCGIMTIGFEKIFNVY